MNTRAMSEAKNGIGHVLYGAIELTQNIANDESASEEDRVDAKRIRKLLSAASVAFYESTGDQSNLTADSSVILEPYERIEAISGSVSADSRVYGELLPLLGSIRNKLPSSAYANTRSSHLINSSMNTGEFGPEAS